MVVETATLCYGSAVFYAGRIGCVFLKKSPWGSLLHVRQKEQMKTDEEFIAGIRIPEALLLSAVMKVTF